MEKTCKRGAKLVERIGNINNKTVSSTLVIHCFHLFVIFGQLLSSKTKGGRQLREGEMRMISFAIILYFVVSLLYHLSKTRVSNIKKKRKEKGEKEKGEKEKKEEKSLKVVWEKKSWCEKCSREKGLREKHCHKCNSCIRRFDHHCSLLGVCVGSRNHSVFLFYLFSQLCLLCLGMYSLSEAMEMREMTSVFGLLSWVLRNPLIWVMFGILLAFGGLVSFLLVFHCWLALNNLTSLEVWKKNVWYLQVLRERGWKGNCFDEGAILNLWSFFWLSEDERVEREMRAFIKKLNSVEENSN